MLEMILVWFLPDVPLTTHVAGVESSPECPECPQVLVLR